MKNFLIHTLATVWDEPPRARHQIANELKKEGKVYFVEKNKVGIPRLEVKEREENVITITPYFWIDYRIRYRTPGINELFYKWLFVSIKELSIDFDRVITFDFTAPDIHNYFDDVIFFSADDNVGLGSFTPKLVINYHTKTERRVAEKAKLCVVTSDYMLSKIKRYNPSTFLIPLGAPEVLYPVAFKKQEEARPVLGLVGYLDLNMDYPLLKQLLERFRIIFIGPISDGAKKEFLKYSNANFVGVKTGDDLYSLLASIDVCIAPYDINIINKGLTPNKLWLYLAVGKPVVVTDIPNIQSWHFEEKLVYKCKNENFIEQCLAAYHDNTPALSDKRMEVARNNSWKMRVRKLEEIYTNSRKTAI